MDKRLVLTSENSILNDPNASIADIRELLEYKKTLNHISDNNNNSIDSIITAYESVCRRATNTSLTNHSKNISLKSIILSYDERPLVSDGHLSSHMDMYRSLVWCMSVYDYYMDKHTSNRKNNSVYIHYTSMYV